MIVYQYNINEDVSISCHNFNGIKEALEKQGIDETIIAMPSTASLCEMSLEELESIYKCIGKIIDAAAERNI